MNMISLRDYIKKINKDYPINDISAWIKFNEHNFIYNKLRLSDIQNINCAPIPCIPEKFPIIVKPIINLYGMSKGTLIINNLEEYFECLSKDNVTGYFWQSFLEGKQNNIDIIMKDGKIVKYYPLESKPGPEGTFKYHSYSKDFILSTKIIKLIEDILDDYTGFLNIEVIDDKIIECHLRLNGDSFIYGEKHFENFFNLIENKPYNLDLDVEKNTMFPIFVNNNFNTEKYKKIQNYLEQNKSYFIEYKCEKINSLFQAKNFKRCFYFIIDNFKKGLLIQNYIYKNFI